MSAKVIVITRSPIIPHPKNSCVILSPALRGEESLSVSDVCEILRGDFPLSLYMCQLVFLPMVMPTQNDPALRDLFSKGSVSGYKSFWFSFAFVNEDDSAQPPVILLDSARSIRSLIFVKCLTFKASQTRRPSSVK